MERLGGRLVAPLILAACCLALLASEASAQSTEDGGSRCPKANALASGGDGQTTLGASSEAPKVQLTPKVVTYSFGGGRGTSDRTLHLTATPKLKPGTQLIASPAGDLEAQGGVDSFPEGGVVVSASVTELGDVRVLLCLDPQQPEEVGRGRYLGTVQIGGPGIETGTVTVEAQLRDPISLAIILAFAGMLVGLALKMLADLTKDPDSTWSLAAIRAYVGRVGFVTSVVLGLVGIGLSLWQLYENSPIWGSAEDMFKIFAAGVALQITGTTVVDFFKPFSSSNG